MIYRPIVDRTRCISHEFIKRYSRLLEWTWGQVCHNSLNWHQGNVLLLICICALQALPGRTSNGVLLEAFDDHDSLNFRQRSQELLLPCWHKRLHGTNSEGIRKLESHWRTYLQRVDRMCSNLELDCNIWKYGNLLLTDAWFQKETVNVIYVYVIYIFESNSTYFKAFDKSPQSRKWSPRSSCPLRMLSLMELDL